MMDENRSGWMLVIEKQLNICLVEGGK